MQGLILEGTTEDSVRLSDDLRLVGDLAPRECRVEIHAAGVCGSDMSCVHGKYYMPTPLVPIKGKNQIRKPVNYGWLLVKSWRCVHHAKNPEPSRDSIQTA